MSEPIVTLWICQYCGTRREDGEAPTHFAEECREYLKAALMAANRSDAEGRVWATGLSDLATHLQAELDQMRRRAEDAEAKLISKEST